MLHAVPLPDPADVRPDPPDPTDVRLLAVGLDLQSRPIEYKDFQSAGQQ